MKSAFEEKLFTLSISNILIFGFTWLFVGFGSGVLTLLGPVRMAVNVFRGSGETVEGLAVKAVMVMFVFISFLISLLLTRVVSQKETGAKILLPVICMLFAMGAYRFLSHPAMLEFARSDRIHMDAEEFVFGPYPTDEIILELKNEGFTSVVSLLHPAVVPFETQLIEQEKIALAEAGLEFIHAPMLPWISDNEASLKIIKEISEHPQGKYYIHCYLGKDRVNIAKGIIEKYSGKSIKSDTIAGRSIEELSAFERGNIIKLSDGVYFIPYPTDEEFTGYILNGNFSTIISLLDPEHEEDTSWIEKEKEISKTYSINYKLMPINKDIPFDPDSILRVAEASKKISGTKVIHEFKTESPTSQAFITAYQTNLPPLSEILFKKPMQNGPVRMIATNVATGPRPVGPEFGSYLFNKGVRKFLYIGPMKSSEAPEDKAITKGAGLDWIGVESMTPELRATINKGKTWYIYGPGAEKAIQDF